MYKRAIVLLIVMLVALAGTALAANDKAPTVDWVKLESAWQNYLDYPSPENAREVYEILPSGGHVDYTGSQMETETLKNIYDNILMLERQVFSGDRNSLKLAFRLETIADGGFAEDLYDILGAQIRSHPRLFLEELNVHRDIVVLDSIIHVGFQVYSDRPKAALLDNQLRIKALSDIDDKVLNPIRDECIKLLVKEQQDYISLIKAVSSSDNIP